MPAERFAGMVATWAQRQPDLFECLHTAKGRASLVRGILEVAALGLSIDGVAGHAYLLPFKDHGQTVAQTIIGYRGLVQLMYRSGQIKRCGAEVVMAGDLFEWQYGSAANLRHKPAKGADTKLDVAKVEFVYSYFENVHGGFEFTVMSRAEIEAIKSRSRAAGSKFSPWNNGHAGDWCWMARKTALRQIAKIAPTSEMLHHLVAREERFEDRTIDLVSAGDDFFFEGADGPVAQPEVAAQRTRALPEPLQDLRGEERELEAVVADLPPEEEIGEDEVDF